MSQLEVVNTYQMPKSYWDAERRRVAEAGRPDLPDGVVMPMSDAEFSRANAASRKSTGARSELLVQADLVGLGFTVLAPVGGQQPRYDLGVDVGGSVARVQVKTADAHRLQVSLGTVDKKGWTARGTSRVYSDNDFDILAIVDRFTRTVYYVPIYEVDLASGTFFVKEADAERYRTLMSRFA